MMPDDPSAFVIPTYRLRDVGETVEAYDENFWRNGHSIPMIVFDDSSVANHEKYYGLLEQTKTHSNLYYVGPREKEELLSYLSRRLRDRKLDALVRNLFRPSYGGNRNFTLMYTLGQFLISSDDDMRPYALIEDSPESLTDEEVSRGKLVQNSTNGFTKKSYDILSSFKDVLGKTAGEVPANYERGDFSSIRRWISRPMRRTVWPARTPCSCSRGGLPRMPSSRWRRLFVPEQTTSTPSIMWKCSLKTSAGSMRMSSTKSMS